MKATSNANWPPAKATGRFVSHGWKERVMQIGNYPAKLSSIDSSTFKGEANIDSTPICSFRLTRKLVEEETGPKIALWLIENSNP